MHLKILLSSRNVTKGDSKALFGIAGIVKGCARSWRGGATVDRPKETAF
jgi:hypothetical protein